MAIRVLYRFTDPIRYVSLILLIDIRFVFGMYHDIFCLKLSEICDVEGGGRHSCWHLSRSRIMKYFILYFVHVLM